MQYDGCTMCVPYDSKHQAISSQNKQPTMDDITLPNSNKECTLTYAQVVVRTYSVKTIAIQNHSL